MSASRFGADCLRTVNVAIDTYSVILHFLLLKSDRCRVLTRSRTAPVAGHVSEADAWISAVDAKIGRSPLRRLCDEIHVQPESTARRTRPRQRTAGRRALSRSHQLCWPGSGMRLNCWGSLSRKSAGRWDMTGPRRRQRNTTILRRAGNGRAGGGVRRGLRVSASRTTRSTRLGPSPGGPVKNEQRGAR